ncbi:MAG: PIG-L family deacetylase [Flavobacteriales bacterium]|nr:PIG-L family deacetylase [Flavobacteriales bacterium]
MKTVLIIAAHPDNEVLGCGGTIARHIFQGDKVHLVFMSDGVKSRSQFSEEKLKRRMDASKLAMSLLGISSSQYLGFQDNKMDNTTLLDIIQKLEPIIDNLKPSVVYTHHHGDLNIDHQLTHSAVMTACRPVPNFSVREIYGFEVLSSTEWSNSLQSFFKPTYYVDITDHISTKISAAKAYEEEMRDPPHSRSIKHIEVLAQHRGYSIGVDMAEAFEIYRIVS